MDSVSSEELGRGNDDLARQRQKRAARRLDQPAGRHDAVTLRDVVTIATAAIEESGGRVDVRSYLASRGHASDVVDAVVDYLGIDTTHPSSPVFDRRSDRNS